VVNITHRENRTSLKTNTNLTTAFRSGDDATDPHK